jgi:hypothetical protein
MSRDLFIRCETGIPFKIATERLAKLLDVDPQQASTSMGDSQRFAALGIHVAFWELDSDRHARDVRLARCDLVIGVSLQLPLTGRMYSKVDSLFELTCYLASVLAESLGWDCFVCTSGDDQILEEFRRRHSGQSLLE